MFSGIINSEEMICKGMSTVSSQLAKTFLGKVNKEEGKCR